MDEQSIEDFERKLNNNLYKIWNRMSSGSYFPKPVRAVEIPKKCKEVHRLIKSMRTVPLKAMIRKLNQILVGYYHYYSITDNSRGISNFRFRVMRSLFFWLNRRSQKNSYTWEGFNEMLKSYPLANQKIYVNIYAYDN